jgi:type IV fimbrial biogenesis protein FimT
MLVAPRAEGFSLIEIAIALAIVSVLVVLSTPAITDFLVNSRIRSSAEAIANGLRQARMEAVKRNTAVQFVLGANDISIRDCQGDPVCAAPLVVYNETIGDSSNTQRVPTPAGATTVTWSALGVYLPTNPDASLPIQRIDINSPVITTETPLRVVADPAAGVGIRMCNPKFALPDPIGCP